MAYRLLRPQGRSVLSLLTEALVPQNHHSPQVLVLQSSNCVSGMRKSALEGNILRLLHNEIQYELKRSNPNSQGHVGARMRRWLDARNGWTLISNRLRHSPTRPYITTNKSSTAASNSSGGDGSMSKYKETLSQLDKLDFMMAAKILFTTPPKKKKFGLDFHLVQFFFACMPSLAVYLVAQYARYEIRRMEAELEVKKKGEEEAKAKEDEAKASEETKENSNPDLFEVKERLGKLEEAVNEIVVESKKQVEKTSNKSHKDVSEKKDDNNAINYNNTEAKSEASNSQEDQNSKPESEKKAPNSHQTEGNS